MNRMALDDSVVERMTRQNGNDRIIESLSRRNVLYTLLFELKNTVMPSDLPECVILPFYFAWSSSFYI